MIIKVNEFLENTNIFLGNHTVPSYNLLIFSEKSDEYTTKQFYLRIGKSDQ